MAKLSFFVKTKITDPKKEVSIRIRLRDTKYDYSATTGERIQLQYWDTKKHDFNKKSFKGKDNVKARLNRLKTHVQEAFTETREIDSKWLNNLVAGYLNPNLAKKDSPSMFEWIEEWIEKSDKAYRTIAKYKATLKSLKEFMPELTWEEIDLNFYDGYTSFLKKDDYAKNTIADRIKVLKVFCNAALERNIHSNTSFKSSAFKKETEDSYNIYLNTDELNLVEEVDLSSKPALDKVRDIFLLGCWTGCRFSDFHKVHKNNIDGDFIRIEQQKTQHMVTMPLHPVVRKILLKFGDNPPRKISNQKFNEYIKEVARLAGIKGAVSKSITKGNKRKTEILNKWDMVSSHTARRSFATNLYKSGFPSISIMAITGHKTEKAFLSYIKVSQEEHAELLKQHWIKHGGF